MEVINEVICLLLVLVLGSISSGAGVGGGALYIPLFVMLLSPNKLAIPLSKACALGASIALFLRNAHRTRPGLTGTGTRPMIDYRMAVLLEPFTLIGTMAGVRLNKLLPFTVIATLMVVLMSMISFKTFHRAISLHRIEQRAVNNQRSPSPGRGSLPIVTGQRNVESTEDESIRSHVIDDEQEQFPKRPILMLFLYWILGILPSVLVSHSFEWHFECLSPAFMTVMISSSALILILALYNAYHTLRQANIGRNALLRSKADEDEPQWTPSIVAWLSLVSFAAGVLSALVGIGGSAIKGPFLAHIAAPEVASSTAAFMLLSTCSASMFQFALMGMLDLKIAAIFALSGFIAAFGGARMWNIIIHKFNKRSIIVFLLASYIMLATVAMTGVSIYEIVTHQKIGETESIC